MTVGSPATRVTTIAQAKEAVKEFQGKTLTNRDSGVEAVVSRNSLDKMLSNKAVNSSETPATHALAAANIDALFENAIHGWVKPDQKGDPSIAGNHRFFARMNKPDGSASMVKMTVKETVSDKNLSPLYTIEAVEFFGRWHLSGYVGGVSSQIRWNGTAGHPLRRGNHECSA